MRPADYIKGLHPLQRDYAKAYLRWLREEVTEQPWEGTFGLSFKPAQDIRQRLGTLVG